jgi:hypothetical protein
VCVSVPIESRSFKNRPSLVTVVQDTDLLYFDHPSKRWRLDRTGDRSVLLQSEMSSRSLIIVKVRFKNTAQAAFIEHEDMVEAIAADGTDQPLDIRILPRRTWGRENLPNLHRLGGLWKRFSIATIAVAKQ